MIGEELQRPNACGIVAAKVAAILREAGDDWETVDLRPAVDPSLIESANLYLQQEGDLRSARWLTGDQVLGVLNMFLRNDRDTEGRWVGGPMPLNHFLERYREIIENDEEVPLTIYIVNTSSCSDEEIERARMLGFTPGQHWFAVASAWSLESLPRRAALWAARLTCAVKQIHSVRTACTNV